MRDGGVDKCQKLLLPVGNAVHDIFGDVYDLHYLHVLIIHHKKLPLYLNVPGEKLGVLIFILVLALFRLPLILMVKHENHLVQLIDVHFAHIVERVQSLLLVQSPLLNGLRLGFI